MTSESISGAAKAPYVGPPVHSPVPERPSISGALELVAAKTKEFQNDTETLQQLESIKAHLAKIQTLPEFEERQSHIIASLYIHLHLLTTTEQQYKAVLSVCCGIATALVATAIAEREIPAAHGKVKDIWIPGERASAPHVYSTPRGHSDIIGKIQYIKNTVELRGELATVAKIRTTLTDVLRSELTKELSQIGDEIGKAFQAAHDDAEFEELARQLEPQRPDMAQKIRAWKGDGPASQYLAIDFQEVTAPEDKIHGKFTLKSAKASGDLEERLAEEQPIKDPLGLGEQVVHGLADLQRIGGVHGDLKPENILLYEERAKIADFGKTQVLKVQETKRYTGNPRYEPPEGRLSHQGEVYSAGIILIRILERNFLSKTRPMLLEVDSGHTKSLRPEQRRLGVERYIVQHSDFPQTETTKLRGKFVVYGRRVLSSANTRQLQAAQSGLQRYVDSLQTHFQNDLIEKLKDGNRLNEQTKKEVEAVSKAMHDLLLAMTQSNPADRPTMEQALTQYQGIKKRIDALLHPDTHTNSHRT